MSIKRAVTLFLCIIIIAYIITGPVLFRKYAVDYNNINKPKPVEVKWKGVISFWDYPNLDTTNGSRLGWIEKRIKEFEENNPGVYIEFRSLSPEDGRTTLMAAAKVGAVPDIAPVGSDWFFISSGLLEPLDEYIEEEDWIDYKEGAIDSVSHEGNIYGLPWASRGYTLLLNKKIFEERGVELPINGQWTYSEFLESLKKLTFKGGRRGSDYIYGIDGYIDIGSYNVTGILMSDGAHFIDDTGSFAFNSPEALRGLQKLYDLKHVHKVADPKFGEMNKNQAFLTFLQGKCAVFMADAWMIPYIRNMAGKYNLEFTVANYPTGEAEIPIYMNDVYYSYGIFKQEDAQKREMCAKFIKYITDKSFTEDLARFGYFSPRKSGNLLYIEDEEMNRVNESLSYAQILPKNKNWQEINAVIQYNIREMLVYEKSPKEVLEDINKHVSKYFPHFND